MRNLHGASTSRTMRADAVQAAADQQAAAGSDGGALVSTEHLLSALLVGGGVAGQVLERTGLTESTLRKGFDAARADAGETRAGVVDAMSIATLGIDINCVSDAVGPILRSMVEHPGADGRRQTGTLRRVLLTAHAHRRRLGHQFLGTEHLLLAVLDQPDSVAVVALRGAGVDPNALRSASESAAGAGMSAHVRRWHRP